MREEVAIVLNDREAPKLNTVKALLAFFRDLNITASQIKVSENLAKVILERCPKVLILDYLLGDFSTGLDILHEINSLPADRRPAVYFLTDEPSVNVAVTAMKLGANNFYEIFNPLSAKALVNEIEQYLARNRNPPQTKCAPSLTLDDLSLQSKIYGNLIENARVLAKKRAPIIVIQGPGGSGKATLARAIHSERKSNASFLDIVLETYTEPLDLLIRPSDFSRINLGHNICLSISHLTDDREHVLMELLRQYQSNIWPDKFKNDRDTFLIVSTESKEVTGAWTKLLQAEVLTIPALDKHREDIPLLISRFVNYAAQQSALKIKHLDNSLVLWLGQQSWPGDIKQLQSVVINTAIRSTFNDKDLKTYLEDQLAERTRGRAAT